MQNDANPADEIPDSEATMADSNAIIPLGPSTTSIAAAAAEAARQRSGGGAVANPIQVEDETADGTNDASMVDATAEAAVTATVVATATKKRRHATGLGNLGNTFCNVTYYYCKNFVCVVVVVVVVVVPKLLLLMHAYHA